MDGELDSEKCNDNPSKGTSSAQLATESKSGETLTRNQSMLWAGINSIA